MHSKLVIVNADDFGLNKSCTTAICEAFSMNYITDTTMIANGEAFDEAIYAAKNELAGRVGIHFNITEGRPLTQQITTLTEFCSNGIFHGNINRYKPLKKVARVAVYTELTAQAKKIVDAGVHITHADSHHHIHTALFIAPTFLRVCMENGIKAVRLHRNIGQISSVKRFCKYFFNMNLRHYFITTDYFGSIEDVNTRLLEGVTEIMVHPTLDIHGDTVNWTENGNKMISFPKHYMASRGYMISTYSELIAGSKNMNVDGEAT